MARISLRQRQNTSDSLHSHPSGSSPQQQHLHLSPKAGSSSIISPGSGSENSLLPVSSGKGDESKKRRGLARLLENMLIFLTGLKRAFKYYSIDTLPLLLTPHEFRFPPILNFELAKFALRDELRTRIIFLIGSCIAFFITDLASIVSAILQEREENIHYFIIFPCMLVFSILIIIMSCFFRKNALYQNFLTIISVGVSWFVTWTYCFLEEGERFFAMILFSSALFTVVPLQYYKVFLIAFLLLIVNVTVLREKHPLVVIQYFVTAAGIAISSFCLTYFNQLQYRKMFLSQFYMKRRNAEARALSDQLDTLLLNILPSSIVEELSHKLIEDHSIGNQSEISSESGGEGNALHMAYDSASVIFIKILDFTSLCMPLNAKEVIQFLTEVYLYFDRIIEEEGLYRIKTIQNTYLAVSGVPDIKEDHLERSMRASMRILETLKETTISVIDDTISVSIGIAQGPCVAGVIGISSYCYDIYSKDVSFSSRMCSTNTEPNTIQLSEETFSELPDTQQYTNVKSAVITAKGFGKVSVKRVGLPEPEEEEHEEESNPHAHNKCHPHSRWRRRRRSSLNSVSHLNDLFVSVKQRYQKGEYDMEDISRYEKSSKDSTLPLDQIAAAIPDKFTTLHWKKGPPALSYFFPVVGCYRFHKLNMLYFKHTFLRSINTNRLIFILGFLLYLGSVVIDVCNILLADRDQASAGFNFSVQYSAERCKQLSVERILINKLLVGGLLFSFTHLVIFSPLYRLHWIIFQLGSAIASIGGIVTFIVGMSICSDMFGQFLLLCYILLVLSLQGVHPHVKGIPFLVTFVGYSAVIIDPVVNERQFSDAIMTIVTNIVIFFAVVGVAIYSSILAEAQSRNDFFFRGVGEKKRIRMEKHTRKVQEILKSIFPEGIVERIQRTPRKNHPSSDIVADYYEQMSISYADIVGFSAWSSTKSAKRLVNILSNLFSQFDLMAERYGVYRLQLVGDNYVSVCGCPVPDKNHYANIVRFALDANSFVNRSYRDISFRFGIHCGYAVAGVLKTLKQQYAVFGQTTTVGELMEQTGQPGRVHVSSNIHHQLDKPVYQKEFEFEARKEKIVSIHLAEPMQTYFVSRATGGEKENDYFTDRYKYENETPGDPSEEAQHPYEAQPSPKSLSDGNVDSGDDDDDDEVQTISVQARKLANSRDNV